MNTDGKKQVQTKLRVTRQFKLNGPNGARAAWNDPEDTEEIVNVRIFDTPPATTGIELGSTLNMENYESARIGVHVTVPCYFEELPSAYDWAKNFVEERYKKEVAEARSFVAARKKQPTF